MNTKITILLLVLVSCKSPELISGYYTAQSAYTADNKKFIGGNYLIYISDSVVWVRNEKNIHTYPISKSKGEYNLYSPPLYRIYFNAKSRYIQIKHRIKSTNYDYSLPNELFAVLYWLDGLKQVEPDEIDDNID